MPSDKSSKKDKVPKVVGDGKFQIQKRLGAGCFGEVFRATNAETKAEVAVKLEEISSRSPQLEHEAGILNLLRQPVQPQGVAEYFFFGQEGDFNVLVIELLGKTLEDRMQGCKGRFTAKTAVLVAGQLLSRIEFLHSKCIVHRDIKPENFMFGVGSKQHHLYLIDYGLSKRYFDKQHIQIKFKLSLTGTARYASINAHRGAEQSRRDDLEAIGHMLLYFLRGSLPWSGLEAKSKQEKYRKIMEKKESMPLPELCAGFPDAFESYLSYCRNLDFKTRPDYTMLRKSFSDVREQMQRQEPGERIEDWSLEWHDGQDLGKLVPLQKVDLPQPDDTVVSSGGRGCCFCGGKNRVRD